jgi:hypothetical protein
VTAALRVSLGRISRCACRLASAATGRGAAGQKVALLGGRLVERQSREEQPVVFPHPQRTGERLLLHALSPSARRVARSREDGAARKGRFSFKSLPLAVAPSTKRPTCLSYFWDRLENEII